MSTELEVKSRKRSITGIVPWFFSWLIIVIISVWVGYTIGFSTGETRGWNEGTTKFKVWFDAEIAIHKKYAEMLDLYLDHIEDKKTVENIEE